MHAPKSPTKEAPQPPTPEPNTPTRELAAPFPSSRTGNVHRVVERAGRVAIVQRGMRYWVSFVKAGQTIRRSCSTDLHEAVLIARRIDAALQDDNANFASEFAAGRLPTLTDERPAPAKTTAKQQTFDRIGRVAIVQRGERFSVSYAENGRTVRKSCGASLQEATAVAGRINSELSEGAPTSLGFQPIGARDFLSRFLQYHELVLRSSVTTIKRYRAAIGHLIEFLEQRRIRTLDRITPQIAQDYVVFLRANPITPNGHPNATRRTMRDKTILHNLEVVRGFLNRARKERHLPPYSENPFSELHFDRMRIDDAKPVHPLTPDEEARFWQHCDPWAARLFSVLAYTGMRPGELETLMIHDLDLSQSILHIRGKSEFHFFTKTRNARVIPLIDEVREAIQHSIEGRSAGPVFLRRRFVPGHSGQVHGQTLAELQRSFESFLEKERQAALRRGTTWNREAEARAAERAWHEMGAVRTRDIRREFIRIATRAGLEGRTCVKDFRHTWATTLQVARVDPFARRDMMGHTGLLMTGHYTHTSPEVLNDEARRAREARQQGITALQERLQSP